jgi:hypothetical protein
MEILNVLESVSVIIASLIAIAGISSWRRQIQVQKESDLAEEVLTGFFEIRDAIGAIRSPFGFEGEGKSRKRAENESEQQSEVLDKAFVIVERYQKYFEKFAKLNGQRYRIRSLFGEDYLGPFLKMDDIVRQMMISSRQLQMIWEQMERRARTHRDIDDKISEELRKWEDVFYGGANTESPVTIETNEMVSEAERLLTRHMVTRTRLTRLLRARRRP